MTVPLLLVDRILWRLGFGSPPPIRRRRTFKTKPSKSSRTRQEPKKTPVKTFKPDTSGPYDVFNVDRKRQAPVKTYDGLGTLEHSAQIYGAPQLNITEERIRQVEKEVEREEAKREREIAAIKTYQANVAASQGTMKRGELSGGIGLGDAKFELANRQWERDLQRSLASLKPPPERPYGQQSPIKMGHSLRPVDEH